MNKDNANLFEKSSPDRSAENILKQSKKDLGKVVRIAISERTTFEFPAHLSQEEIDIRIANYKKRHTMRLGGW